ncbi:MAG: hypothetical protein EOS36_30905 [Mesorhizobium sp.]|uniref:hypothetical protein n=1 Tax=Mesorhizobium sp. TaxID=1871066 RepID=UPI000FE639A6|nr:hypothetical protein [Mesorhizobium sp.]RWD49784.1 MAG: hypothetical protein EOS36_30905 [Mesorhizobium sp.]RWE34325.1 MAG: hypothetical protein EOS79_28545 [Mesorhizobium sp.]
MKNRIFCLLVMGVVLVGWQPVAASAAQAQARFRTCSGFDGPFQVPASQKCPLSGYAHSDEPTKMDIQGRPRAATQARAPRASKFRTCSGFDGPFQIPLSQKCPLSGYAHSDEPTEVEIKARSKAASAPRSSKFRNCTGIDGAFQVPVSQKCPLSGYAHY